MTTWFLSSAPQRASIPLPLTDDISLFMVIGFVNNGHKYTLEATYDRYECTKQKK